MSQLLYLGCPYSHESLAVRLARQALATELAAKLAYENPWAVFSPITHGHQLAGHLPPIADQHEFWMGQCMPVLRAADRMMIVPIQGWRTSKGLAEEIAAARLARIPVSILQSGHPAIQILDGTELAEMNFTPFWME